MPCTGKPRTACGGWLWEDVLGIGEASGWLGAIVVATLGAILVLLVLRAMSRE
jgi:uncharacterized membrane protein YeaQ/YmgE (transglycosylase-associated protein family)